MWGLGLAILFVFLFFIFVIYNISIDDSSKELNSSNSINKLLEGNKKFVNNFGFNGFEYIEKQKPHTVVLCCSDSRVPIEMIFNVKKGELFVIRELGCVPSNNTIASIEYAIKFLGVQNLLVIGHTSCGAIKTVLSNIDTDSKYLNEMKQKIKDSIGDEKDETKAVESNVKNILLYLNENSQTISNSVKNGNLIERTGIYDIEKGKIFFY